MSRDLRSVTRFFTMTKNFPHRIPALCKEYRKTVKTVVRPREAREKPDATTTTKPMVEVNGIEPMTSCLQSRRSPN